MPAVYNRRHGDAPEGAVYVGRPSVWGNPFAITGQRTREDVVRMYRRWLEMESRLVERARRELRGKDLVCWCAPLACHADVLLEIANDQPRQPGIQEGEK